MANEQEAVEKTTEIINPQLLNDPIGYFHNNQQIILDFCLNLTYAIIILVLGWLVAKVVSKITLKVLSRSKVEATVARFVSNIIKYAILVFVITAALSRVGIQTASFVAIIGAASFAIGMSLQGSLSNFASGVLLLLFRPIKVGEYIEVAGLAGTVEEVTIFTTTLLTPDNKFIIIPNSAVSSGNIINYSRQEDRRVDFVFGISYDSDIDKARTALEEMFKKDSRILQDKGIQIVVGELAASSINLTCRVWVKGANYWDVFFAHNENAVKTLRAANIDIPFQTINVIQK